MNLPELSVRRPVTVTMIILIIMVLGVVSFTRLGLDFFPDLEFPEVLVLTTYEGASPEEMETLITRPLEESVATVSGVTKVKSISREGVSVIQAELNWGSNLDLVAQDIRNMMDITYDRLPDQVDRPLVMKTDFDLMPILYCGVLSTTDRDPRNLRKLIEDRVEKQLETLPGVAAVTLAGGLEREILVEVDRQRLEAHTLSLDDIMRVIRSQNRYIPGGHITQGTQEYVLRTIGKYSRPDQIADTIITVEDGRPVYIRDVATVRDAFKEVRSINRTNKRDSLIFWITKESGANTVRVNDRVKALLDRLEPTLPPDIRIVPVWDTSKIIRDSVRQLGTTVRWGGLICMVVLFAFLMSVRTTLTLAVAIPFALISTFIGIYFAGYTLNLITLSGLALGVGMIVDNSVVVLENIFRRLQGGEDRMTAARKGATEVLTAITASTLTSVIVFVPFLFATGLAGEMTKPMGLTVTFALFASLLVAVTIVPMLASRFLRAGTTKRQQPMLQFLSRVYRPVISFSLRHRLLMVVVMLTSFALSIGITATGLRKEYMPKLDEIYTTCVMKMAPGSSLKETYKYVSQVEDAIMAQPEFRSMISLTGLSDSSKFDIASGAGPAGVNESEIFFEIVPKGERDRTSVEFLNDVIASLPKLAQGSCYFMQTSDYIAGGGQRPIEVNLFGDDLARLKELSDQLAAQLRASEGIVEIDTSLRMGKPELKIRVDREKAATLGITAGQVADTVDSSFLGRKVSRYREAGDEYDIRVRFSERDRRTLNDVGQVTIPSSLGFQVNLSDIAQVVPGKGPIEILREHQERKATVSANYNPAQTDLGAARALILQYFTRNPLPEGYHYRFGGAIEDMEAMGGTMIISLLLIVLLVYMVMAAQFESLVQPLSIMAAVPLSFIGVALGLLLTGQSLSVMSFIGIIMLVGIVVNNAIVYIDYTNQLRRAGMDKHPAIIEAGLTRLRPILMTTLTTCLAIVPMAVSRGEGAELFKPIAITIFCGLITSTFLTLVVVPSLYSLVDSGTTWCTARLRALRVGQRIN